jgi:hypothetical protein
VYLREQALSVEGQGSSNWSYEVFLSRWPSIRLKLNPWASLLRFDPPNTGSWDSSVSVVTRLRSWRQGIQSRRGQVFFSKASRPVLPLTSTNWLFIGYWELFLRAVKRPGCQVDHSSQTSANIWNVWSYTIAPSIRLRGMCRDNFIFTFCCLQSSLRPKLVRI